MIPLPDFLAANPDARVHGPVFAERFDGFSFDSRIVQPGELFLAVKTPKADGHDHIEAACRGGAAGVVCQRPVDLASFGASCVVVPDTEVAIQRYAAFAVRRAGIPVVAITGSAGKTTTKELVAHVLSARYRVFRNPGNYNGRYGLPIALGGLDPAHEIAVIEMGIDQFGEMAAMTEIAPPDVAAVTLVAPAHLSVFGTIEAIAKEKGDLVAALRPDGLAVLNADDPRVAAMAARTQARVVRCGVGDAPDTPDKLVAGAMDASRSGVVEPSRPSQVDSTRARTLDTPPVDVGATEVRVTREGTVFILHVPGAPPAPARIPWLGAHFARAALIAVAIGRHFGLPLADIVARLAALPPVRGRLVPIPGPRGSLILDDSYNASPEAVFAGFDVLANLDATRRVAVLGDMAELGEASDACHRQVGRRAAGVVDALVTRGKSAALIAEGARAAGLDPACIAITYTADDAVAAARAHLDAGAVAYVKGSAVARMEQVVAGLMGEPERAPELLVRQDAAWRQIVVLQPDRPTWVEVDLGAVGGNVRALKRLAGGAQVMAVLKADAYGHGAAQVAHTALRHGATWCAVACLSEGLALRQAGIDAPILVLGYTPAWQAREAVRAGLAATLFDRDTAAAFSQAAQALDRTAHVHVKVDTGMRRLGLDPADTPAFLRDLRALPGLVVEGLFTHTACADDLSPRGREATTAQLEAFDRLVRDLEAAGLRPPLVHAANSAVLAGHRGARYDLVRPGIAVYGLAPSPDIAAADLGLRPAMAWKTQVAQVRDLAPGEAVGYGHAWRAERPSRIATIPVGYADGFRRAPRTWRRVLVRGVPAPVVGRVSMDQSTVDVTGIAGVRQGDEVVLIGRQGDQEITAELVGEWLGTINYEVVSAILARVPRVS